MDYRLGFDIIVYDSFYRRDSTIKTKVFGVRQYKKH